MPIYEYQCRSCKHAFQRLIMGKDEMRRLSCPRCGATRPKRLISMVAYHVSEQDRLATYNPRSRKDDAFYKDSRNIGLHAKKTAQRMGVDLGGSFEDKLEKLRTDPGSVIRDSDG